MSDSVTCTFVQTGKKLELQDWYECLTCKAPARTGLCVSCAVVCHAGHNLTAVKNSKFYCDCGAGNFKARNGLCKCLTPCSVVPVAVVATAGAPVQQQPMDADILKVITANKTILASLTNGIGRKDVILMTKFRGNLVAALHQFNQAYQHLAATNSAVSGFINEASTAIGIADSLLIEIMTNKQLEAASKDVINYAKNTESAIKRKDVTSVQHNYGFLQKKYPAFYERFGNMPAAVSVIDLVNSVQFKYESEFGAILADKEIGEQIEIFKPMVGRLETAIQTQNITSALRWINELKSKFPIFVGLYSTYPKSHSIIELVNNVFLKVEGTLSTIIIEKEISDQVRNILPSLKGLQGALSRRDSKSSVTWFNRLSIQLNAFQEKYYAYPQSQHLIQECTEWLIKAQAENFEIIQEEKINKFLTEIKPKVAALKGSFERKDVDSTCNWRGQVSNRINAFEMEFSGNVLAQGIISNVRDLLNKVDSEFGQVLVDKKIQESIKIMQPMLQALIGALDRKDIDIVIKYRNQLSSQLTPFTQSFSTQSSAQAFIQTSTAQLNRVATELGPIIEEKEINDRILILKPLVSGLRGSFERQDVPAIISKKRVLEARHQDLISQFPKASTSSVVVELVQLLGQINTTLGDTIIEKEIEVQIQSLMISYKALTGSLQRKDVLSSINWKRQLEKQLSVFTEKYSSKDQATRFIQESRDLITQVDQTLGSEMEQQLTTQMSQMSLKSTQFDVNAPIVIGEAGTTPGVDGESDEFEGMVECNNKTNAKPKLAQNLYLCLTCFSDPNGLRGYQGVCAGCRDVCHIGHVIGPMISVASPCSCEKYEESNGPCQCMDSKQFPRQEYQENEWVKALGTASDDDLKFILYCFKYIKEIANIFNDIDDDNKDRQLTRIGSLQEGIFSIAKQIGVNLNGPLKTLIDLEVNSSFAGTNQKLVTDFWAELMQKFQEKCKLKPLNPEVVEKDNVQYARHVYFQRYKFIEWGFIQGTPAGRALYDKYAKIQEGNVALIKNPIPFYKDQPTSDEKKAIDAFFKEFCDITTDSVPQFSKLPEVEKLLASGVSKFSKVRYFKEFEISISDYVGWLKYIEQEKGAKPSHLPQSFENVFGHNDHPDLALYALYHRDWIPFFYQLGEFKRKYGTSPKCKYPLDQVKFDRFAFYASEFRASSTDVIKSSAFPLVSKWERKGKTTKSQELIPLLEKHLSDDSDYLKLKSEYNEYRTKRSAILKELTAKDQEFNSVLKKASSAFQSSHTDAYIKKSSPISHESVDNRIEMIPKISSFKGKDIAFNQFRRNDPNQTIVHEMMNGNWKLCWNDEVDGGDDYKQSRIIATDLVKRLYAQSSLSYDISKSGNDALAKYIDERGISTKQSQDGMWTAVGKIKGLYNFTTHHSFIHPDESYALIIPKGAHSIVVDKRVSHWTYEKVLYKGSYREERVNSYKWHVRYSLDKVAVDVEVKSLICDLFTSLEGSKSSLTPIISDLKKI